MNWDLVYFKIAVAVLMLLFIPLISCTYVFLRQRLRMSEDKRRLDVLNVWEQYKALSESSVRFFGMHLMLAVLFLSIVIMAGLVVLLFPNELKFGRFFVTESEVSFKLTKQSLDDLRQEEIPEDIIEKLADLKDKKFNTEGDFKEAMEQKIGNDQPVRYKELILQHAVSESTKNESGLVAGMAFLGAYLWGLQYLVRRYFMNDLIPGLYYRIGLRMFLAVTLALLISNAFSDSLPDVIPAEVWPAAAFLIGTFPQRGLQWLMARIPLFSPRPDPSVRELPLEMIEGVSHYDKMRLEELGIDNCHDLADEDLVPLMIRSPYNARKLINWLLQAKLCVHVGYEVRILREHNIRRVTDLKALGDEDIERLATETTLTKEGMLRAKKAIEKDKEIETLLDAAFRLSQYTHFNDKGSKTRWRQRGETGEWVQVHKD